MNMIKYANDKKKCQIYNVALYKTLWYIKYYQLDDKCKIPDTEYQQKCCQMYCQCLSNLNSLWPGDAIWWHKSGLTLAQDEGNGLFKQGCTFFRPASRLFTTTFRPEFQKPILQSYYSLLCHLYV